ncbi:MAG: ParB/RepB/Spo0J family partition protein [Granulosicoccus sp.]
MAKRPRMGRNLNALLGSAARERTNSNSDNSDNAVEPAEQSAAEADKVATPEIAPDAQSVKEASAEAASKKAGGTIEDGRKTQSSESDTAAKETSATPAGPVSIDTAAEETATVVGNASGERLIMLGVEKIRRGTYQPRRLFDQELLQELADSIKAEGMIQPIIVRPFADGYELVAGERRWRASQLAGIDRIPAIVRDMEDRSVAAVSVIENIQRKDLNPLEEAAAFQRLCDEFGMTHKAVAEAVGRSRASVTNLMRLLELHDEVKVMVDKGELEMGHARALLGAPRTHQPEIARRIVKQGLTVRAVEKYVRSLDADGNEVPAPVSGSVTDPDIERLSKKLGEKLGAQVQISHKGNGTGKLQISYSSVSELQGILAHIK